MALELVVITKIVPDGSEVFIDPVNLTLNRSLATNVLNPADENALELALQVKARYGGRITVLSMTPPFAIPYLEECVGRGADRAILLSDKAVAGSDTYPTSLAIAAGIRHIGKVDIVFAGEKTSDSSTGHVGPGVAEFLDAELASYVSSVEYDDGYVIATREFEEGTEVVKIPTPAVVTVLTNSNNPRKASLRRKIDAIRQGVIVWDLKEVGLSPDAVGLRNSPTIVKRMIPFPRRDRKAEKITIENIGKLVDVFEQNKLIKGGE